MKIDEADFLAFHGYVPDEKDILEHYGVKGMKWGVRKDGAPQGSKLSGAERRKREARRGFNVRGSVATLKKRFGSVSRSVARSKDERLKKSQAKAEKKMAKDRYDVARSNAKLMRSREARKGREIALTTHSPKELSENMQYLTNDELKTQLSRLKDEQQIRDMANKTSKNKREDIEKKIKAASESYLGKAVTDVAKKYVEKKLGIDDGISKAVGTKAKKIVTEASNAKDEYDAVSKAKDAAEKTADAYKSQRDQAMNAANRYKSERDKADADNLRRKQKRLVSG